MFFLPTICRSDLFGALCLFVFVRVTSLIQQIVTEEINVRLPQ